MKRFTLTLILLAFATASYGQRSSTGIAAPIVSSGSWQWTVRGYATLSDAAAVLSAASSDPVHPVLIDTQDADVATRKPSADTQGLVVSTFGISTPFVVFRWEHVDLWCCTPAHFTFVQTESKNEALAKLESFCVRPSGRRCGIVGSASTPFAGSWVVWKTEP